MLSEKTVKLFETYRRISEQLEDSLMADTDGKLSLCGVSSLSMYASYFDSESNYMTCDFTDLLTLTGMQWSITHQYEDGGLRCVADINGTNAVIIVLPDKTGVWLKHRDVCFTSARTEVSAVDE